MLDRLAGFLCVVMIGAVGTFLVLALKASADEQNTINNCLYPKTCPATTNK